MFGRVKYPSYICETIKEKETMETITITDIAFTYLWDDKYFRHYNLENNLTEEEIDERCEELKSLTTLEVDLEDYGFDGEEDDIDDFLINVIEEETGEYFSTFSWEIKK